MAYLSPPLAVFMCVSLPLLTAVTVLTSKKNVELGRALQQVNSEAAVVSNEVTAWPLDTQRLKHHAGLALCKACSQSSRLASRFALPVHKKCLSTAEQIFQRFADPASPPAR